MAEDKQTEGQKAPEAEVVPAWAKSLIDGHAALRKDFAALKAAPKTDDGFVDDEAQNQAMAALTKQITELQGQVGAIRNAPTEQLRKDVAELLKVKPESLTSTPVEALQAMKAMNTFQTVSPGTDGASGRGTFSGGTSEDDKAFILNSNDDSIPFDMKRANEIARKLGVQR